MKHNLILITLLLALVAFTTCSLADPTPAAAVSRQVIALDGTWQIAEGGMDAIPAVYEREVPVPGLVDLARPAFVEPGPRVADGHVKAKAQNLKDPRRDAFWYRRSFQFAGPFREVARLKVGKAMFGTRVFLNGKLLGDHAPCFTPGWFDAKDALQVGANELIIRVGADPAAIEGRAQSAHDGEKLRYIPGIFDSAELILSGSPHIMNVQAVPDIERRSVTVHAWVRCTPASAVAKLHITVREVASRKLVGEADCEIPTGSSAGEQTGSVTIPVRDCHLWSPEDPFLYELEVRSAADTFTTRFGMRSFRLDPATGRAMLNGKPYFLRGSNVTLYRFFEDDKCGTLPWNEEWVRKMHKKFKEMHWNSLRHCIGFPPEFWYRIADEEGILLQDEYPIWRPSYKPGYLFADQLAVEYREWMQERWNHPSVVIWDSCNETWYPETGKAVQQVRGLDFSRRPWDNGWGVPVEAGDSDECHPYHFIFGPNQPFRLRDLANDPGTKPGLLIAQPYAAEKVLRKNPLIINEYGGLWLNRDGTPTTLSQRVYDYLLEPSATTAQRRQLYARTMAAITEFFRAHRQVAGVLHFCALGYSRPDGQTSDDWADVEKLTWDPDFFNYVRDAFAPVGLMLDFWDDELPGGEQRALPVVVINDLYENRPGQVRLRLLQGNKILSEQVQPCAVPAVGEQRLIFNFSAPTESGAYTLEAALVQNGQPDIRSLRDIAVLTPEQRETRRNLALGRPVRVSWISAGKSDAEAALPELLVDGDRKTGLTIPFGEWLAIDLGTVQTVSRLEMPGTFAWSSTPTSYVIQVSPDGESWQEAFSTTEGTKTVVTARFKPVSARWVRIMFRQVEEDKAYSLNEVCIFH